MARKFNLNTANKRDSQGLCFVGKVDMKDFLLHFVKSKKGSVLDTNGKKVGIHQGATFLTIGQRHGFTVTNKKTLSKPLYIASKNIRKNTITVSEINKDTIASMGRQKVILSNVNWITSQPLRDIPYKVRLRYRQKPLSAKIYKENKKWIVSLAKPSLDISNGQSLVIYRNDECLGGGIIENISN